MESNSEYVDNWSVRLLPNGIYSLVFNLSQDSPIFYAISDNEFVFGDFVEDIQYIPDFLPKIEGLYIKTSAKTDSQIVYHFMPYLYEWVGSDKCVEICKSNSRMEKCEVLQKVL